MPNYDDGESFAAGDEDRVQFDNARLQALIAEVNDIVGDDPPRRRLLRLAILRAIFGEAEDR